MKKSEKIVKPQVGQIWLASNTPFEITGYFDEGKMVWCQNLNSGIRWGEGLGNFERGDYKRLKPKKKIVIKELGKQLIDAENYIVCLENEMSELKAKLNTEPQRTQSEHEDTKAQSEKKEEYLLNGIQRFFDGHERFKKMHQSVEENKKVQNQNTKKFGCSHPEYPTLIRNLSKALDELQKVCEGDISCQIYERISESQNNNQTHLCLHFHDIHQYDTHKHYACIRCAEFHSCKQRSQYMTLFGSLTFSVHRKHHILSDEL